MICLTDNLSSAYNHFMDNQNIAKNHQSYYRKWLRYYINFCKKYRHAYVAPASLSEFLTKLENKGQSETLRKQAQTAVLLYYKMLNAKETIEQRNGEAEKTA